MSDKSYVDNLHSRLNKVHATPLALHQFLGDVRYVQSIYGYVSVADVMELLGANSTPKDLRYGWIGGSHIFSVGHNPVSKEYNLDLNSQPVPLCHELREAKKPHIKNEVKELREFSVGGNLLDKEHGCIIAMYNEDEEGNEHDSVYIRLSPKQARALIDDLLMFLPESYKRSM